MQRYKSEGLATIILAGAEYGSGSSRDWAAKGPMLLACSSTQIFFRVSSLAYPNLLGKKGYVVVVVVVFDFMPILHLMDNIMEILVVYSQALPRDISE